MYILADVPYNEWLTGIFYLDRFITIIGTDKYS